MRIAVIAVILSIATLATGGKFNPAGTPRQDATVPWIIASDWDDTIKAGGHGALFGIRGVGKRVKGTYPGMTTLLGALDPCWTGRQLLCSVKRGSRGARTRGPDTFQVWSAKPFGSKKQSSCSPPLHREPVTRHGGILAGLGWVISNKMPECKAKTLARSVAARALGRNKFNTFRREAESCGPRTEILFFGDSAQGDAHTARLMVDCPQYGAQAFVLLHDLTRGTTPYEAPRHEDTRIAIKQPFDGCRSGWQCPRVAYYKTTPEAAFLLAQLGFLSRSSLQYVVEVTRHEMGVLVIQRDEAALERLRRKGQNAPLAYDALVRDDLEKCEALLRNDAFWRDAPRRRRRATEVVTTPAKEKRPLSTVQVSVRDASAVIRRSTRARERARRAESFRAAALASDPQSMTMIGH